MRAWLLDDFTGLGALHLGEAPEPVAEAGEQIVDVELAALNPADRYLSEGQYPARPPLPHILGRDGVGVIQGTTKRVMILRGETGVDRAGTFAQRVAVADDAIIEPPAGWSDEESAGAALVYLTAYQALTQWGDLPPSVVLITGASGGVGVAGIQLGRAMGHTMVALSRDGKKRQRLLELGAHHAIDPTPQDWPKTLKKALWPQRVDLAIDNIGGPLFPKVIDTLGDGGRVSVVGRLAGPVPQFNTSTLLFRRLKIGGVAVASYAGAPARAAWKEIVGLMDKTGARPVVDRVFPFEQLPAAFAHLAAGPMGKVLLSINR